jgi:hypothetical protein
VTAIGVLRSLGTFPSSDCYGRSLPGTRVPQHTGVTDVPAVDRQAAVRHQGLHPRIQAAVGVRKNGHSNHGTGTAVYAPGSPVSRIAIAFIACLLLSRA